MEKTSDLSPAAQAVLRAYEESNDCYREEWGQLAAALRAAAKQLGYCIYDYENNEHPSVVRVNDILAIAAELEGG